MPGIADTLVDCEVTLDGKVLPDELFLRSVTIDNEVDRIPKAEIVISITVDPAKWKAFLDEHSKRFQPRAEVEIKASNNDNPPSWIYTGRIDEVAFAAGGENAASFTLSCSHAASAMTRSRATEVYEELKDSDICSRILNSYGFEKGPVAATKVKHKSLVQYESTDWDFVLTRADANGLHVHFNEQGLSVSDWSNETKVDFELSLADDIIDIDIRSQNPKSNPVFESISWDPGTQKQVLQKVGSEKEPAALNLRTEATKASQELKEWAQSRLNRYKSAQYQGSVRIIGAPLVPGQRISITDLGGPFDDPLLVGAVRHEIFEGSWYTELRIGIEDEPFGNKADISPPHASGLVPGIQGLRIAKVLKRAQDPDGGHRVQVNLNILDPKKLIPVWARMVQFLATRDSGALFIPDVGDEVIVGFLNDDPNDPIILGSLYNAKDGVPEAWEEEKYVYLFKSPSGAELRFESEGKIGTKEFVQIKTAAGNSLRITDKDQQIVIEDEHKNKYTMESGGITLDSAGDIKLSAKGNINLDAKGNIELKATSNVDINGTQTAMTAKTAATVKGSASAEISASGNTIVKGAMVMIN